MTARIFRSPFVWLVNPCPNVWRVAVGLLSGASLACSDQDQGWMTEAQAGATSATNTVSGGGKGTAQGTSGSGGTAATGQVSSGCGGFGMPVVVGRAQPAALESLSGLVASRNQPGVYYAHPDRSGALFYALDESGAELQEFTLSGITATDLEDIAVGPGPDSTIDLFLGDIGDNAARSGTGAGRAEIQVYRLKEPTVSLTTSSTTTVLANTEILRFVYPDRTHDAETLMVDPATGTLIIVTREEDGSAFVFSAPSSAPVDVVTPLTFAARIEVGGSGANAGDISPSGELALIRTYQAAWLYLSRSGPGWPEAFVSTPEPLGVANETQPEGVTFSADGKSWLSSGERDPTIHRADDILCL